MIFNNKIFLVTNKHVIAKADDAGKIIGKFNKGFFSFIKDEKGIPKLGDSIKIDVDQKVQQNSVIDINALLAKHNIDNARIDSLGVFALAIGDKDAKARLIVDGVAQKVFNPIKSDFQLYEMGSLDQSAESVKVELSGKLLVSGIEVRLAH